MYLIHAQNINDALPQGYALLQRRGITRDSRYGLVTELDEPVTTHYNDPLERVLFSPKRDANPFLHLFESLWILAGRNDVAFLEQFAKRMREFSDDGTTYRAAYGHRLRHWGSGYADMTDQLQTAIDMLRADPGSRRVVCSIWDVDLDLNAESKDIPCNDMIKFEARSGRLNMVVFNRSNDLVWGTYGANAVQFAFIQEYVAAMAGLPVGWYEQVSCNFHMYANTQDKASGKAENLYTPLQMQPYPLVENPSTFDRELRQFLSWCDEPRNEWSTFDNKFFSHVAAPLYTAHKYHKNGRTALALDHVQNCIASDWRYAAFAWLARRLGR
jgi:thymidylate synthase